MKTVILLAALALAALALAEAELWRRQAQWRVVTSGDGYCWTVNPTTQEAYRVTVAGWQRAAVRRD